MNFLGATNEHSLHLTGDVNGMFLDWEHALKDLLLELLPLGVQILESVPQLFMIFGAIDASDQKFLMTEEGYAYEDRSPYDHMVDIK